MLDTPTSTDARWTARALTLSFSASLLAGLLILVRAPGMDGWVAVAAPALAWLGLGGWLRRRRRAGRGVKWMLSLATLNLLLVTPELALRAAGYERVMGMEVEDPDPEEGEARRFGFPERFFRQFEPHPDLFWTYPPTEPGVNAWGFHDEPVPVPKPPGTFRMAFLGDSCTDYGEPHNYPTQVELILDRDAPPDAEAVILAVSGYSSHQGQTLADLFAGRIQAEVAFAWFGWNDHWEARGPNDAARQRPETRGSGARVMRWLFRHARLLQALAAVVPSSPAVDAAAETVRVPLAHYRSNLQAIRDRFTAQGTTMVFITAPTTWYHLGVSHKVVDGGLVPDKETGLRRHEAYNQVVREVAGQGGARLLDLEKEFREMEDPGPLMTDGGIHLTPRGIRWVGRRIATFLAEEGLLPRD